MRIKIEYTLNVDVEAFRREYADHIALDADLIRRIVNGDARDAALIHFERTAPGAVFLAAPAWLTRVEG